jgi:hypothetical protein
MDGRMWNRWGYFSWIGFKEVNADGSLSEKQSVEASVSGFKYSDALNEVEGILIEVIEPKLNKQSGRLQSAREYFQVPDERVKEVTAFDVLQKLDDFRKELKSK